MNRNLLIEVYEVDADGKRRLNDGALEFLEADPAPLIGDLLLLPSNMTVSSRSDAFVGAGAWAPFRVVDRTFLYGRDRDEVHDPLNAKPARYEKHWLFVRRLSPEEYETI